MILRSGILKQQLHKQNVSLLSILIRLRCGHTVASLQYRLAVFAQNAAAEELIAAHPQPDPDLAWTAGRMQHSLSSEAEQDQDC